MIDLKKSLINLGIFWLVFFCMIGFSAVPIKSFWHYIFLMVVAAVVYIGFPWPVEVKQ